MPALAGSLKAPARALLLKFEVVSYAITTIVVKKIDSTTIVVYLCRYTGIMAKIDYHPTEAELEILNVIWDIQPVTVRDVHARISAGREIGYTTVLKQIQRLTEKGALEKIVRDGVHFYQATETATEVKQRLVDKVRSTAFGGSALDMMMHALGRDKVSPEELRAIKDWLDQQL